jgi:ribosomal protein L16/L10AE
VPRIEIERDASRVRINIHCAKPGRVLFEMGGIPEEDAREAMRLAANKLPIRCKFVKKGEETGGEQ